jgi:hypothetical protein
LATLKVHGNEFGGLCIGASRSRWAQIV